MTLKVFCGEALCKAPVAVIPSGSEPWPVRCGACGTALYPADILTRLLPSEFEPKRGELMTERRGLRVAVSSGDFTQPSRAPAAVPPISRDIDQILAMVESHPTGTEASSGDLPQPSRAPVAAPPTGHNIDQILADYRARDPTGAPVGRVQRRKMGLLGVAVFILVALVLAALITR